MTTVTNRRELTLYATADALDIVRAWLSDPEHIEALAAAEGDLDALPELRDLLEQAELEFKIKAERVALVAREKGLRAKMIAEEIERLKRLQRADESAEKGLKAYLLYAFRRVNVKKVDGTLARPRVQANPPAVKCTLPPEEIRDLHLAGSPFTLKIVFEPEYTLPAAGVLQAYKDAVEEIGPCPELGEPEYHERRELWEREVDAWLRKAGVPDGVRVERGAHVRIG